MSSDHCSVGRQGFAIGYTLTACVCVATITYYIIKLIHTYYCKPELREKRPSKWIFLPNLFYVLLCTTVLIKCIIYGVTHCNHVDLHEDAQQILFDIIFRDLYAIRLYFLWMVLLIRIYFMFRDTPYMLSKITIRVYSIIFIFAPLLTVLLSVPSLYTIFIVLGLSGGIFITLSIVIVYIFKLIQVYTRYAEYEQQKEQHEIGLLDKITKNTILVVICTLFSLLILFILIMNFVFSVFSMEYAYQEQFLRSCLLLDAYAKAICVIFMFAFFHDKYERFCGCLDIVCRYYCNQFVNPAALIRQQMAQGQDIQPVADEAMHFSTRSSVALEGGKAMHVNVVGDLSPEDEEKATEEDVQDSASYEMAGKKLEKTDFEDIPSLPSAKGNDNSAYIAKAAPRQSPNFLPVPAKNGQKRPSPKLSTYWANYHGMALDHEEHEQKQALQLPMNQDSINIHKVLMRAGFDEKYTKRALVVYEKYYGNHYDIRVIREIIYRLQIKDKLKELKRKNNHNLSFQKRDEVEAILLELNFSAHYINTGLTMYEVCAEMFDIHKHHVNVYDLELVTEMIMRLRAKDRDRGGLVEDGDNLIMHNETNETFNQQPVQPPPTMVDVDGDGMIETHMDMQAMDVNPYDGYYAQASTQPAGDYGHQRQRVVSVEDVDAPSSDEEEPQGHPYGHAQAQRRRRSSPPQQNYNHLAQQQAYNARYMQQGN